MESVRELEISIAELELKKEVQEKELKDEVKHTIDSFRPSQLLKRGVRAIAEKPFFGKAVGITVAATTFELAKKFLVSKGTSALFGLGGNLFKKIIGFRSKNKKSII